MLWRDDTTSREWVRPAASVQVPDRTLVATAHPSSVRQAFFGLCHGEVFVRVHDVEKLVFFHSDGYIVEVS